MAKRFSESEKAICAQFAVGKQFCFGGGEYEIVTSGKPICFKGEPKTDVYVLARSAQGMKIELKISFKQRNADFLENKTNKERAEAIFGVDWQSIIGMSTLGIRAKFEGRHFVYKSSCGKTGAGAITLGWRFELLNKPSGELSGEMLMSREQVIDVYAGTNLPPDKRNSKVNGEVIKDSGIATHLLFDDMPCATLQETIDSLYTVEQYVERHPKIYFACKALNYRSATKKYDGNRPLAVYVDWSAIDGKLSACLVFDAPLLQGGKFVLEKLLTAMQTLGIKDTRDITAEKIQNEIRILG